ncbi:MAG: ATP-dependent DNA helicase RecG [Gammaproteobacteria bacterium]|nr:MAG: ATP-dependent DNA helicase RecG [Gammaproteobacteria bacterium]
METTEILEIIARGEDGRHQFKANVTNSTSLSQEMVAFSNSVGGMIIIGVSDDGSISGLKREDIGKLSNIVSNAASQQVKPPINPITENFFIKNGFIMVVHILPGISKPYMDKDGVVWVKSGPDKRKATSREEIQRMYQDAGLIHGDEIPVSEMTINDIDEKLFAKFYEKEYEEKINEQELPLKQLFDNLNLSKNGIINVAGLLLFGKNNKYRLPAFVVKCVTYPSFEIDEDSYLDSQDISGAIKSVFDDTMGFVLRNIKRVQKDKNVNSLGELEIPKIVFEELIVNALIHRDYFISAPIRIFIFSNRIEIISPGSLSNNLTIENIKSGNSNIRNPILATFATKLLPYRGLGNGVRRALKAYENIQFFQDKQAMLFTAVISYKQ